MDDNDFPDIIFATTTENIVDTLVEISAEFFGTTREAIPWEVIERAEALLVQVTDSHGDDAAETTSQFIHHCLMILGVQLRPPRLLSTARGPAR